jgi:hypothetical protein
VGVCRSLWGRLGARRENARGGGTGIVLRERWKGFASLCLHSLDGVGCVAVAGPRKLGENPKLGHRP